MENDTRFSYNIPHLEKVSDESVKKMTHERQQYVIVCGGTGGHIYPGLAVASALREVDAGCGIVFVGTRNRMESRIIPEAGYAFHGICVEGIHRRLDMVGVVKNVRALCLLITGIPLWQSMMILGRTGAGAVFGTGGYFSGPVLLAARILGIPCVSMEPNMVPGLSNRLAYRLVNRMIITHEESGQYFPSSEKCLRLGTPVRPEIFSCSREDAVKEYGLDPRRVTVLVMGGSLGSKNINDAVNGMVRMIHERDDEIRNEVQVIHSVGTRFFHEDMDQSNPFGGFYRSVAYLERVDRLFPAVDLFIGRVGASTVGETTALGIPMILIPWRGVHQAENAEALARAGAAMVIYDDELTPELLYERVAYLVNNHEKRMTMVDRSREFGNPDAAADIARLLMELNRGI